MLIVTFFVIILLLWVIQKQWKIRRILILSRKLRNDYLALPLIGHGHKFLGTGEDRMKTFQILARDAIQNKYGMTNLWLGSQYYAMTCDPIIAGIVSKVCLGKTEILKFSIQLLGNGLLFAPVHIWRPRRKILTPLFSPKILNSFFEIFVKKSMILVNCLQSKVDSGTFSIWKNITSCTMDSICQTTLDIEMNVQNQYFHPFLEAFDNYSKLIAARITQPWLHWDFLYKLLPVYQETERNKKIIHDFVDDTIRRKKELHLNDHTLTNINANSSATSTKIPSFLDLLIKSTDNRGGYTNIEIREELLVLLIAGTDTSAVGASFTIVMLSRYLNVQEKAYEEIREVFGDSERAMTAEDLSRLQYIDALIRETLRLYPPVPIILRQNDEDVELPSGITLPAGSCTAINIWGIHRNPRYWGADADQFNPDRFLNGNVTPQSAYMPFSYGPRNCLGYKYAMMSMKVMVTTLLRYYKVLPPSELSTEDLTKPLRVEFSIMMKDVDNFKVRLQHRV